MRLTDRLFAARDRLLANPRFQSWAADFPLTRGIAAKRASRIFDLTAGFVYAQILQACVQLRLFEHLRDGPRTVRDLAPLLGLDDAGTLRLLKAAAALGLVARRGKSANDERYALAMDGAALLGNPGALSMIEHHDLFYADLADPVALLRRGSETRLASFWPYAVGDDRSGTAEGVGAYSALMSRSLPLVAQDILDAFDFQRHTHLLDAGGGDGTFLREVAARSPTLAMTLFDLPAVAAHARDRFDAAGMTGRATVVGGDLWRDPLPRGADIVSLVRVLHDHDDEPANALLRRVFEALPPGGTLLIAEPMVSGADGPRVGDAYFGFYLLAMGSGRARTPDEICAMAHAAGFAKAARKRTRRPLLCSIVVAQRAA